MKKHLKTYCGSKVFRQFMAFLDPDEDSEKEEREMADIVEEVIAQITDLENGSEEADTVGDQYSFSHIETIEDQEILLSYTSRLQNVSLSHFLTSKIPNLPWLDRF